MERLNQRTSVYLQLVGQRCHVSLPEPVRGSGGKKKITHSFTNSLSETVNPPLTQDRNVSGERLKEKTSIHPAEALKYLAALSPTVSVSDGLVSTPPSPLATVKIFARKRLLQ